MTYDEYGQNYTELKQLVCTGEMVTPSNAKYI